MLKITGLDELTNQLDHMARVAEELEGTQTVLMTELLSPEFVSSHTKFVNAEEMFEASGFKIESQDDFAAIPDAEWDEFIRSISSFSDWQSMLSEAGSAWAAKKLGI
ncbi:hypothetical protein [Fluviibacter phosphoraccumulans]|uniref:Uncharacterized protein n=1 Tax=Fluviibacter phosphoraccumulans TaxID=1751046 RepID=A0A7R6QX73_9RHOO|nr:hypothetical protein [Fluviibacter phosphoraccumulans]BBU68741.1 hypothetical protein ICHIAU1_10240 [Fluviibacter phosphoraccumulans]BBU72106.1 hypothetical protein ICHIJ1_20250 [Fluviibacter phosphoraccumulans]